MNWYTFIQKIRELAEKAAPYIKAFFAFVWEHKIYSLVTFALGALAGVIFL
jgi:hypothetical protein